MKNLTLGTMFTLVVTALLSGISFAAPMTPEVAAKKENFRKQQEQRITPDKKKAAAEALKAERLKVYNARQAVKEATPAPTEIK